jgi:tetratricopeptide (TPR) repeat protein
MLRTLKTVLMAPTLLMIGVAGVLANGQQGGGGAPQVAAPPAGNDANCSGREELMRSISLAEAVARSAEAAHAGTESLLKIYKDLTARYEEMGMYPKAEDVTRREISLLRNGPQNELADAIGHIAVLHAAMGEERKAEKDEVEVLAIRESLGDPVGIAQTQNDLADIDIKQRHYRQALTYVQEAMPVLADSPRVEVADRITVRQTMAYALCGLKQCGPAVALLKDALELEKKSEGEDSFLVGTGYYFLGYTAWQNGDLEDAAAWMQRGVMRMKANVGLEHTLYLNALGQYAQLLRERGQMDAAAAAEREVKMANEVVDVHSLAGSSAGAESAGLQ